jgi:D-arabinan exo alpha-(1,3)/(1,5)-arabinofuranosidase (non-reducing end)
MIRILLVCGLLSAFICMHTSIAQESGFNGLGMSLGTLSRLSHAKTRSISPENFTGEKGKAGMAKEGTGAKAARELGQGWKISPSVKIDSLSTFTLAEIKGPGAIQHIWMTPGGVQWRFAIIRMYWDGEKEPSVECPVGDFFASGWEEFAQVSSLPVAVNPGSALNCFWEMPFRRSCRITIENLDTKALTLYYQITYALTDVPEDAGYFHAQFRRINPLPYKDVYTIVDGIKGWGHYVGTYMAWGVHNNGWWGEGEIKFYVDGDGEFPTICGTGTEDYFLGSYGFEDRENKRYAEFTTPFSGMPLVIRPDGLYRSQQRFSLYRWHVMDPIRFDKDLRVTMQALGWRSDARYMALQDDIASVAFWYQREPHAPFPRLPGKDSLEIQ